MSDPKGEFFFPGIPQPLRGEFTLSHGISPGVCTIDVAPGTFEVSGPGTLTLAYDGRSVSFVDCKPDKGVMRLTQGGYIVTLSILDRRWRWRYGEISGHYNQRNKAGNLRTETEKTPQELATLCLRAMGESGFDASALPSSPRPTVDWSFTNPAQALASLCDSMGCSIAPGVLDNRVRIVKRGVGRDLPDLPTVMSADFTFDPPELPGSIKFVGGATRWQDKFTLEAVGIDADGAIKPIDDLSYKPDGGWSTSNPLYFDAVATDTNRKLAQKSVFRWYRIKGLTAGRTRLPEFGEFQSIAQLLPIEDGLIETEIDPLTNEKKSKPPVVSGKYNSADFGAEIGDDDTATVPGEYSINRDLGIVVFNRPVFIHESNDEGYQPAELTLEVAFSARDAQTGEPHHYTLERQLGGGGLAEIVSVPEVVKTLRVNVRTPATTNEQADRLAETANGFIDTALTKYQVDGPKTREYAGFLTSLDLDGAITQITWESSKEGAVTRASRNTEHSTYIPSYQERRRREKIEGLVNDFAKVRQDIVAAKQEGIGG